MEIPLQGKPAKVVEEFTEEQGKRIHIKSEICVKNDCKEFCRDTTAAVTSCRGRVKKIKVREVEGKGSLCHNERNKKATVRYYFSSITSFF